MFGGKYKISKVKNEVIGGSKTDGAQFLLPIDVTVEEKMAKVEKLICRYNHTLKALAG